VQPALNFGKIIAKEERSKVQVLSHYQTSPLCAARAQGLTFCTTSIDLGITSIEVTIASDHIIFPDLSVAASCPLHSGDVRFAKPHGTTPINWCGIAIVGTVEAICLLCHITI
jgi:hypothetical protein